MMIYGFYWTVFFQSWKLNKIRNKPKGELKQTHLMPWTQCEEKKKGELLRKITNGDLDFAKFKEQCLMSKKSLVESNVQEIQEDQETDEDEDVSRSKDKAGNDGEETVLSDDETSTRSVSLRDDSGEMDIANPSSTCIIGDLQSKLNDEQKRNEDLHRKLKSEQEKNEELKTELTMLKSELTEAKKWSQSWEEKFHTVKHQHAEIHLKMIQQQDALKHAEAAAARARMKSKTEEEKKKNEETLSQTEIEVTEKGNNSTAPVLQDSTTKGKKRKQKETEEEEMTEVDCGLVQYDGKIYFGTFETSEKFVFCKLPIATINAENNAVIIDDRAKTREINMRDCQTVNKEDIVLKQKGRIDAKGNVMIDLTVSAVKETVKKFIRI